MKKLLLIYIAAFAVLTACTSDVPYRNGEYTVIPNCKDVYYKYDTTLKNQGDLSKVIEMGDEACWKQSREQHEDYDILFTEFDDQGWVQGAANETSSNKSSHLRKLYDAIDGIYNKDGTKHRLALVVFVHGWKHNAEATDTNVQSFQKLLQQISQLESIAASDEQTQPRVVGIYVGWRGKSLAIPGLDNITFWERKNTAKQVAQGSVQELFLWLDLFRDTAKNDKGERIVSALTIGHSFGGLITYEALSSEFVRNTVRFKNNPSKPDDKYMSRVGDLVVIVNPAFEGARYEVLRAATRRSGKDLERNQLPVVVIATSEADAATRYAFPIARAINTMFESTQGEEWNAAVWAVGHNSRYITHELSLCESNNADCRNVCNVEQRAEKNNDPIQYESILNREYTHMYNIAKYGFDKDNIKPSQQYLCNALDLKWTDEAIPNNNPYWVVQTTEDIMSGHNDIFNDYMISFVRQMYTGFMAGRNQYNQKKRSKIVWGQSKNSKQAK
jgi:hypothetical protein